MSIRPTNKGKLRGCLHESGLSYNPDRTHSISVENMGLDYICLHESGLSYNPDRTHSISVENIRDWIIFVYMNPD